MVTPYERPQQMNKEESGRLRGERHQIKFIYIRFEIWQVVGLSELRCGRPWWPIQRPNRGRNKKAKG